MFAMNTLEGHVAVVTGGTLGVGRGIASALAQHGARVFVTGRSVQDGGTIDERIIGIRCDHRLDAEVTAAFERVARESRQGIDILVNNVWGGYERMVEDGAFTWAKPFWEQPLWRWDARMSARECARTTRRASWRHGRWSPEGAQANREHLNLGGPSTSRMSPTGCRKPRPTR